MHSFSATYGAAPEAAMQARSEVCAYARRVGAGPAQVADVRLAVSESVTNAVLHAYDGTPGDVHVSAERRDDALLVRVRDTGRGMKPRPGEVESPPGLGTGLGVIGQLADEMSVGSRADGGTDLRMRFELGAATGAGRASGPVAAAPRAGDHPATA